MCTTQVLLSYQRITVAYTSKINISSNYSSFVLWECMKTIFSLKQKYKRRVFSLGMKNKYSHKKECYSIL